MLLQTTENVVLDHTDLYLSIKQRNKKCKPHEMMKKFIKYGTQLHIQLAARREFTYKHYSVFLLRKNISTCWRVTRQETTFTQTISENQRLQTKTPEK